MMIQNSKHCILFIRSVASLLTLMSVCWVVGWVVCLLIGLCLLDSPPELSFINIYMIICQNSVSLTFFEIYYNILSYPIKILTNNH